jgi:multimeric flavodoxin WrbA
MKKVLGIVGSPRRNGNTHVLVSRILEGAQDSGASADILFLNDLNIRECDGCHACWKDKPCSKKDDMNDVYAKIVESDVLVLGTPVYWYGPTALMKAFIDRFVYFNTPKNRKKIKGKSAIIAVPFEEEDLQTAGLVVEFFRKSLTYLGIELLGQVLVPGVTRRGEISKKTVPLEEGYELGKKSVSGGS